MRSCRPWASSTGPLVMFALIALCSCKPEVPESSVAVARPPRITPDYAGVVIPPNIAPLNFVIDELGESHLARIHSLSGTPMQVASATGKIVMPQEPWKTLVSQNAGQDLQIDVYVKTETGIWSAAIPGTFIDPEWDRMYFLEVIDDHGNGRMYPDLEAEMPYVIVSLDR